MSKADLPRRRIALVAGVLVVLCAACSKGGTDSGAGRNTTLLVSIAASLRVPFDDLATAFERTHPDVNVELNPGPTGRLIDAIKAAAPVDVIAVAGDLTTLLGGSHIDEAHAFASNELVVAFPGGVNTEIGSADDLAAVDALAICAPAATCGSLADSVLAGLVNPPEPSTISRAGDAGETTAALTTGDADAALIYLSDAINAGPGYSHISLPGRPRTTYTIAVVSTTDAKSEANAFVDTVRSTYGRTVFAEAGFATP